MIYKRLGEILIAAEYITQEQLNKALEIQKRVPGKKIGEILVEQEEVPALGHKEVASPPSAGSIKLWSASWMWSLSI